MSQPGATMMDVAVAENLLIAALQRAGCDLQNATALAANICLAELSGAHSHGFFRLPGYLASLRSGKVNGAARPRVHHERPGVLRVDGDGGFTPMAHQAMLDPVCSAARAQGVVIVAIVNTHHFSALWIEVEALARLGLVALACTSFKPAIPPHGSKRPLFGTNPIAFGVPRAGKPPMVFDQASSVMARGDVMLAARAGRKLPEGVGIDVDGNPTTDPNEVLKGGLLPYGGYKGSAIAMMVELLAGPLLGESLSFETAARDNNDGGPPRGGEFILAIDPACTRGDRGFSDHAELLFVEILKEEGTRLPGDRRNQQREQSNGRVHIPVDIMNLLEQLVA